MIDKSENTILVTGATGRQGGAVAKHLVQDGWQVRTLSRHPDRPRAQQLTRMGVDIFEGDLNTITADHPAFQYLYGIFSVQTFTEEGVDAEIRQGRRLADIAKEIGVNHFVYSSVGECHRHTGIPHFESKRQIEMHLRELEIPTTVVRPVFFMENFDRDDLKLDVMEGRLNLAMKEDRPLQMIAVDDIGGIVATIFDDPEAYLGQCLEIAGDELTMPQAAAVMGRVVGRPVTFHEMAIEKLWAENPLFAEMFQWLNEHGFQADVEATRKMYPQLKNFETWLKETGWETLILEEELMEAW
jgi:uncharacterized protein YbjT (DUF2867 family)